MALNAPTTIVRGRPNPGTADRGGLATYSGSPLDVATSTDSLMNKSNQILDLVKRRNGVAVRNKLINDDFKGFKDVAYQDTVLRTSEQIFIAGEHYTKSIKFDINCRDYYVPDAYLVIYMQMLKEDGTAASKDETTLVEGFWARFFTSIKVKKLGDVNVINVNSDDIITQFNLYMGSKVAGYADFDEDILTTSKRYLISDKDRRPNNPAGVGETNPSITGRLAQNKDRLAAKNRYVIPLRALCNFFSIKGPIPPDVTLSLELMVNQNVGEFTETTAKNVLPAPTTYAKVVLTRAPELIVTLVEQTPVNQMAFEQIFNVEQSYRLWDGLSWKGLSKEIPTGVTECQLNFDPEMYQYRWLEVILQTLNSYQHPNVYCNYDKYEMLSKFKKITIDGILTSNSSSSIVYDRAEELDIDDLYSQYLARVHDFTYSRKRKADYGNSLKLVHSSKGLGKRSKFLTYNMPMWIDLSATRSYTRKPDPPNAVVQPQIKINFSVVTTESYILRVNAYYPSQYALTSIGSGQTSSRVVTFLPTISTAAR